MVSDTKVITPQSAKKTPKRKGTAENVTGFENGKDEKNIKINKRNSIQTPTRIDSSQIKESIVQQLLNVKKQATPGNALSSIIAIGSGKKKSPKSKKNTPTGKLKKNDQVSLASPRKTDLFNMDESIEDLPSAKRKSTPAKKQKMMSDIGNDNDNVDKTPSGKQTPSIKKKKQSPKSILKTKESKDDNVDKTPNKKQTPKIKGQPTPNKSILKTSESNGKQNVKKASGKTVNFETPDKLAMSFVKSRSRKFRRQATPLSKREGMPLRKSRQGFLGLDLEGDDDDDSDSDNAEDHLDSAEDDDDSDNAEDDDDSDNAEADDDSDSAEADDDSDSLSDELDALIKDIDVEGEESDETGEESDDEEDESDEEMDEEEHDQNADDVVKSESDKKEKSTGNSVEKQGKKSKKKTKSQNASAAKETSVLTEADAEWENVKRDLEERSLFVTKIPKNATCSEIFSLSTDIMDVQVMKRSRPPVLQYGYILFESKEKAEQNHSSLQNKVVGGNQIVVDFCGKENHAYTKIGYSVLLELHIFFLKPETTIADVAEHFPKANLISSDIRSGCRHFKVGFETEEDALNAFKANKNTVISGKKILATYIKSSSSKKRSLEGELTPSKKKKL